MHERRYVGYFALIGIYIALCESFCAYNPTFGKKHDERKEVSFTFFGSAVELVECSSSMTLPSVADVVVKLLVSELPLLLWWLQM